MPQWGKTPTDWMKENWTWASAVAYVYISILGMAVLYVDFNMFGVNILPFVDISDFFVAAVRTRALMIALALSLLWMVGGLGWLQSGVRSRLLPRWQQWQTMTFYTILVFVGITVAVFSSFFLNPWWDRTAWKKKLISKFATFCIVLKEPEKTGFDKKSISQLALIGTTSKNVLLYDKDKARTLVMPIGDVILIQEEQPPSNGQKVEAAQLAAAQRQWQEQLAAAQRQWQEQLAALRGHSPERSPSCAFTRDLFLKRKGNDVRCLQQYLNTQTSPPREETSVFDAWTKAAVERWQQSNGLSVDGYFGKQAREKYRLIN